LDGSDYTVAMTHSQRLSPTPLLLTGSASPEKDDKNEPKPSPIHMGALRPGGDEVKDKTDSVRIYDLGDSVLRYVDVATNDCPLARLPTIVYSKRRIQPAPSHISRRV
jgi:hypothetical protein